MAKDSKKNETPSAPNSWGMLILGLIVVTLAGAAGLIMLRDYLNSRPLHLKPLTASAAAHFEKTLREALVPAKAIRREAMRDEHDDSAQWYVYRYDVEVPRSLSLDSIPGLLREALGPDNVIVQDAQQGPDEIALSLHLVDREFLIARLHTAPQPVREEQPSAAAPEREPVPVEPEPMADEPEPEPPEPLELIDESPDAATSPASVSNDMQAAPKRLAVILDDGGYGGAATEAVLNLDPRLTLAILPYTPQATTTAQEAAARGFEIMLHLPMASEDPNEIFEGTLEPSMSAEELRLLLDRAMADVPGTSGVNNHMGSKFCQDRTAVEMLLDDIKRRGLYFVDSRTIHTTVAYETAVELGVPAAERDIFLDHDNDPDAMAAQWDQLVNACREQGHAIGIGHFREGTAALLAEKLPELEKEGIELVHVSALVNLHTLQLME